MQLKMDRIGGLAIIYYVASSSILGLLSSPGVAAEVGNGNAGNPADSSAASQRMRVAQDADTTRTTGQSVQSFAGSSKNGSTTAGTSKVKIIDNDDQPDTDASHEEAADTVTKCDQAKTYLERGKPGDIKAARQLLQTVLTTDTGSILARRLFTQALVQDHKPKDAIDQLRYLQTQEKPTSIDYSTFGDAYFQQGDLQLALSSYEQSLRLEKTASAEAGKIRVTAKLNQIDEAIAECRRAIATFTEPRINAYFKELYKALVAYKASHTDSNAGGQSSSPAVPPPLSPDKLPPFILNQGKPGGG